MKAALLLLFLSLASLPACAQTSRPDLFDCEGCEAIYEHTFEDLTWHTALADDEPGEPMRINGTVYHPDGTTPAADVILYVYHTNAEGRYPTRGNEKGWARRHGYLRGWMKTDAQGRYQFESIKPAAYPTRNSPIHIHMVIKEPDRREYWIDSINFEGDPLLDASHRANLDQRGGPGIITLIRNKDTIWQGTRDVILER